MDNLYILFACGWADVYAGKSADIYSIKTVFTLLFDKKNNFTISLPVY